VETARQIFIEHVIQPALKKAEGMPRLWALCTSWLGHVEARIFDGGCFFTAASFEFDSRPGPVRDAIVAAMKKWLRTLSRAVEEAKKAGHVKAGVDPERFAFEIYSLAIGGHWGSQLFSDGLALDKMRSTILGRLRAVATPKCPAMKLSC